MNLIPCEDFYEDQPPIIPKRPKRANPDAIADRWANFIYSMDLSPLPGDEELGNQHGAWSLGDIPSTFVTQTDDDNGDDLICCAIVDRVYYLDPKAYRDEWLHNAYVPIYRMITIGPIPFNEESTGKAEYDLKDLKRFLEFQFSLRDASQSTLSKWRISVGEWENEDGTYVIVTRAGSRRMRARVNVKGRSFIVRLEHAANEPIHIEHWEAIWQSLGRRLAQSKKAQ